MDGYNAKRTPPAVPAPTPTPGALLLAPEAEAKASPSSLVARISTEPSALRSRTPTATSPRTPDRSTAATPCSETTRRRSLPLAQTYDPSRKPASGLGCHEG